MAIAATSKILVAQLQFFDRDDRLTGHCCRSLQSTFEPSFIRFDAQSGAIYDGFRLAPASGQTAL